MIANEIKKRWAELTFADVPELSAVNEAVEKELQNEVDDLLNKTKMNETHDMGGCPNCQCARCRQHYGNAGDPQPRHEDSANPQMMGEAEVMDPDELGPEPADMAMSEPEMAPMEPETLEPEPETGDVGSIPSDARKEIFTAILGAVADALGMGDDEFSVEDEGEQDSDGDSDGSDDKDSEDDDSDDDDSDDAPDFGDKDDDDDDKEVIMDASGMAAGAVAGTPSKFDPSLLNELLKKVSQKVKAKLKTEAKAKIKAKKK